MGRHFRRRQRDIAMAAVPVVLSILTMLGALSQALTGDFLTAVLIMAVGTATVAFIVDNLRQIDRLRDKLMEQRMRHLHDDVMAVRPEPAPARIIPLEIEGPDADQLAAILGNAIRKQVNP